MSFLNNIIEFELNSNKLINKKLYFFDYFLSRNQMRINFNQIGICTRFPPEPNGLLHIGHIKSIFINFKLSEKYIGLCNLRIDDTNPSCEKQKYVNLIVKSLNYLDFTIYKNRNLYFASDYFEDIYIFAKELIKIGCAYIYENKLKEINFLKHKKNQISKNCMKSVRESLIILNNMKNGKYCKKKFVLKARISNFIKNIKIKNPIIYRIKKSIHYKTKNIWGIYPTYSFAHPIEDSLEDITHSICTTEFESQKFFYLWIIKQLVKLKLINKTSLSQYEISKLKIQDTLTSKRKFLKIINNDFLKFDNPNISTILGLQKRGYTSNAIKLMCKNIGISKSDSYFNKNLVSKYLKNNLEYFSPRSIAISKYTNIIINNFPYKYIEKCIALVNQYKNFLGQRKLPLTKNIFISIHDFCSNPKKKYFRLFPGNYVRLRHGYVLICTGFSKDNNKNIKKIFVDYLPKTKSKTKLSNNLKVKKAITWISKKYIYPVIINSYENLFFDNIFYTKNKLLIKKTFFFYRKKFKIFIENGIDISMSNYWQFERFGYFKIIINKNNNYNFYINKIVDLVN